MVDKVILTNLAALEQKYGGQGVKSILKAVKDLIAADKTRGLSTTLVALDDATAMNKLKATPVTKADDPEQNKKAIDGVYKALVPDYLMILGAIDVIPHQDLRNPLFTTNPDGDTDRFAYGDLPYACDAPYSDHIQDFTGPARVIGRLPDLTGASGSPRYLIGLLKTATNWKSSPQSAYQSYLGISAQKWIESTAQSLTKIFGSHNELQTSPKKSYKWKPAFINRRAHFINCHGGDTYPNFLGQSSTDDDDMPVSHEAAFVSRKGKIVKGTVAAFECCYGGQLYDPSGADEGQMGMCNAYLGRKAYGCLASTTTAYGPFTGNDQADLICQYFLQRVLAGSSLGRAALEARQRFIEKASPLSPTNRKTLAQFNLYGDPSIVPVVTPPSTLTGAPKGMNLTGGAKVSAAKSAAATRAVQEAGAVERAERRETLRAKGTMLSQLQPSISRMVAGPSNKVASYLRKIASQLNLKRLDTISFNVKSTPKSAAMPKGAMAKGIAKAVAGKKSNTTAFHIFMGFPKSSAKETSVTSKATTKKAHAKDVEAKTAGTTNGEQQKSPIRKFVVLEAKEVNGKIVNVSEAHSK